MNILMSSVSRKVSLLRTFHRALAAEGGGKVVGVKVSPEPGTHCGLSKLLGEKLYLSYLGNRCLVLRLSGVEKREKSQVIR